MSRQSAGRLVVPDPRLAHIYRELGASTDSCDVMPADGGRFTCPSSGNELEDGHRHHRDGHDGGDIVACALCVPVGNPAPPTPPRPADDDVRALRVGRAFLALLDAARVVTRD